MSETMVEWRGNIRRQTTASGSVFDLSPSQKFQHLLDSIPGNEEGLLHKCAISGPFSHLCMAMILANAIWLGYEADQNSESATGWQHAVSVSFTLWFIFELAFKIIALQRYFIVGPDWKWNIFDTLLVLVSIPELFASSLNVSLFRVVRLFKLSKALRVLRLMKFVRSLRVIMFTLLNTLGTLFWCFVAMSMFAYISAILFKQAIAMSLDDGAQFNQKTMHTFRSAWSTMFALYGIIAGGGDWYGLALDFEDQGAHFAQYLLSIWIFITIFGFLNVVLAVFCSQGTEAIFADVDLWLEMEQERRFAKLNQLAEIFNMIDTKSSGSISWDQFHNFATGLVGQSFVQSHGLQLFAIRDVWQLMDKYSVEGQDGEVDLSAFVMGFMRLSGEAVGTEIMLLSTKVKALRSEIRDACHELRCDIKKDLDCRARHLPRAPRLSSAPKPVETAADEVFV